MTQERVSYKYIFKKHYDILDALIKYPDDILIEISTKRVPKNNRSYLHFLNVTHCGYVNELENNSLDYTSPFQRKYNLELLQLLKQNIEKFKLTDKTNQLTNKSPLTILNNSLRNTLGNLPITYTSYNLPDPIKNKIFLHYFEEIGLYLYKDLIKKKGNSIKGVIGMVMLSPRVTNKYLESVYDRDELLSTMEYIALKSM